MSTSELDGLLAVDDVTALNDLIQKVERMGDDEIEAEIEDAEISLSNATTRGSRHYYQSKLDILRGN